MTAFQAAIDALFADPSIAQSATHEPIPGGGSQEVSVVVRRPDRLAEGFDHTELRLTTTVIEVRASEATPAAGDVFELADGSRHVVQGAPTREDPDRLIWSCDTRPE